MSAADPASRGKNNAERGEQLLQNLRDYADAAFALIWQRQAIFLAAALLTAFYFDPIKAVLFYVVIILCEIQDLWIAKRVAVLSPDDKAGIRQCLFSVLFNTILSSGAISAYVISVAAMQETGGHFTPLFFLFAAALFAAMNNHQIVWALAVRLAIYGLSFLYITVQDILMVRPDLSSELWLQFFTVVFVMYFLIDCSVVFLRLYRRNLAQLQELKAEHERTKAALVVKSQFVSIVSHELRTPLTSIKGSLELINSGQLGEIPPRLMPLIAMASKNSQRLAHLIDDLLDLQKIEAGEMKFKRERVNIQGLVADAIAANEGLARKYNVTLGLGAMAETPLFVLADEARLMQVLSNIISNAAKFSFEGGDVVVGCSLEGGKVRIFVRDHGVGIPEGSRDKVFDRFTQLDSSDQRRAGGTGLGMNISREIVEQLSGRIDYESEVGVGTTFFVEFPVARPAPSLPGYEAANVTSKPRVASGA
ncbi:HAMP domain-containing histidine kinase [Roseibacterium sp. SDUM158016]|jgi:signal transduction histidine kinase|uniref:sensor histidine kinase n=1 Tax=Roseicyclus sediminis TaxID=2980997 RepID=UPI0021CE0ACA|nr:HAMP domain-containing sensor histidine kinase [Roseibacterium sp. SDUM158016]MCU4652001.1 HAMP domain-containing histidine kinase [Roseibacterium sp. SDUM158016]